MVVASKCPEDESGNFLKVLEEVLYYFLLAKRGVATISKVGDDISARYKKVTYCILRKGLMFKPRRPFSFVATPLINTAQRYVPATFVNLIALFACMAFTYV